MVTDFDNLCGLSTPADTCNSHAAAAFAKAAAGGDRYEKGRYKWNGLTLVIEYPKGSTRSGTSKTGKAWSTVMKDHYGYFAGKDSGADDDEVDFFLSEANPDSELVFVVNQVDKAGRLDEHKCILGCVTEAEARETYLRNYPAGWDGLGSVRPMTLPDFKAWLDTKPEKAAAETEAEFWSRNEASKERNKDAKMGHIRDGYIPCPGCHYRYHEMPEDNKCPKCGTEMRIRLRSIKRAAAKNVFDAYAPVLLLVKRAADDTGDRPFTIAVDFDGTLAEQEEPFDPESAGPPRERAVHWVRLFHEKGARIIIFTVRGDTGVVEKWLAEHDVPYDHINENPDQPPNSSGKVFADVYWDDRAFNAADPDEHGPEILRRVAARGGREADDAAGGPLVTISRHTVITIGGPALLGFMEAEQDGDDEQR